MLIQAFIIEYTFFYVDKGIITQKIGQWHWRQCEGL